MGRKQYLLSKKYVILRDGGWCLICGPEKNTTPVDDLELDHADGDEYNDDLDNLAALCPNHNCLMRAKTSKQHLAMINRHRLMNAHKRECARAKKHQLNEIDIPSLNNPSSSTDLAKENIDYYNGSPQMKAASIFEGRFRDYALRRIATSKAVAWEDLVYAGAENVGCSPCTTERYLKKFTSRDGILEKAKDSLGQVIVRMRRP